MHIGPLKRMDDLNYLENLKKSAIYCLGAAVFFYSAFQGAYYHRVSSEMNQLPPQERAAAAKTYTSAWEEDFGMIDQFTTLGTYVAARNFLPERNIKEKVTPASANKGIKPTRFVIRHH